MMKSNADYKDGILGAKKGVSNMMHSSVAQYSCNSLWALNTAYVFLRMASRTMYMR